MLDVAVHVTCTNEQLARTIPGNFKINSSIRARIRCPTVFYSKITKMKTLGNACEGEAAELELGKISLVNGHPVIMIHKIDQLGQLEPFQELYSALCVAKKGILAYISHPIYFIILAEVYNEDQVFKLVGTYEFLKRVQLSAESVSVSSVSEDITYLYLYPELLRQKQGELLQQLYKAKYQFKDVQSLQFPETNESMTQVTPDSESFGEKDEDNAKNKKAEAAGKKNSVRGKKINILQQYLPGKDEKSQTEEIDDLVQKTIEYDSPPKPASVLPQSLIQTSHDMISPQPRMLDSQTYEIEMLYNNDELNDHEIDEMLQINSLMQKQLEQKKQRIHVRGVTSVENLRNSDVDQLDVLDSGVLPANVYELYPPRRAGDLKVKALTISQYESAPISGARDGVQSYEPQPKELLAAAPEVYQVVYGKGYSTYSEVPDQKMFAVQRRSSYISDDPMIYRSDRQMDEYKHRYIQRQVDILKGKQYYLVLGRHETVRKYESTELNYPAFYTASMTEGSANLQMIYPLAVQGQRREPRRSMVDFDFKSKDIHPKYLVYLVEVEQLLKRHKILFEKEAESHYHAAYRRDAAQISRLPQPQRLAYILNYSYRLAYYKNADAISSSGFADQKNEIQQATQNLAEADEYHTIDALNYLNSYLQDQVSYREQSLLSQSALRDSEAKRAAADAYSRNSGHYMSPVLSNGGVNRSAGRSYLDGSVVMGEVHTIRRQIKQIKDQVVEIHLGLIDDMHSRGQGRQQPSLVDRARDCRRNIAEIRDMM